MTAQGPLHGTRVLVVHPAPAARRAVRAVLEPLGCLVAEVGAPAVVPARARDGGTEVLLLHDTFADALAQIRRDPDLLGVAVVLVGDPPDPGAALAALERGAHDVLSEHAPAGELAARVLAARRERDMRLQLLSREHELERLAYRDELTGVANRRFALRQLHALLSRARRHGQELSVVLLDADRFKALNDRYGHGAGDDVLRGLAARLSSRVREEDVVARFGGEEFLVILPDTGAEGAAAVAEDLRAAVSAERFPCGRLTLPMTVSVGWATWAGEELERLIARADAGLYAAKDAGRDRVHAGRA